MSSQISFFDGEKTWPKSSFGDLDMVEHGSTATDILCSHVLLANSPDVLVILDTSEHAQLSSEPAIGESHIRFYAGSSIIVDERKIGTLSIFDTSPRSQFNYDDRMNLLDLAQSIGDVVSSHREARIHCQFDQSKLIHHMIHTISAPLQALDAQLEVLREEYASLKRAFENARKVTIDCRADLAIRQLDIASGHIKLITGGATLLEDYISKTRSYCESQAYAGRYGVVCSLLEIISKLKQLSYSIFGHGIITWRVHDNLAKHRGSIRCFPESFFAAMLVSLGQVVGAATVKVEVGYLSKQPEQTVAKAPSADTPTSQEEKQSPEESPANASTAAGTLQSGVVFCEISSASAVIPGRQRAQKTHLIHYDHSNFRVLCALLERVGGGSNHYCTKHGVCIYSFWLPIILGEDSNTNNEAVDFVLNTQRSETGLASPHSHLFNSYLLYHDLTSESSASMTDSRLRSGDIEKSKSRTSFTDKLLNTVHNRRASRIQEVDESHMGPTEGETLRAVVISKSVVARKMLRRLLESNGCSVMTATDGKEGLTILRTVAFHLAIVDFILPIYDGLITMKYYKLWETRNRPNEPIMMVGMADADKELIEGQVGDAYENGMHVFVTKPLTPSYIKEIVTCLREGMAYEYIEKHKEQAFATTEMPCENNARKSWGMLKFFACCFAE